MILSVIVSIIVCYFLYSRSSFMYVISFTCIGICIVLVQFLLITFILHHLILCYVILFFLLHHLRSFFRNHIIVFCLCVQHVLSCSCSDYNYYLLYIFLYVLFVCVTSKKIKSISHYCVLYLVVSHIQYR